MEAIERGDWVQVWGQVKKINEPGVHPDDVVVEFFSHNEQWAAHVRKDRVVKAETPDFAGRCVAMTGIKIGTLEMGWTTDNRPLAYLRCDLHHDHQGPHRASDGGCAGPLRWIENDTAGYFEDA